MSRQLIVGCVDPKESTIKAAADTNGQTAFELSWLDEGDASKFFSFDTPKGVLPPDKDATITMTFHPKVSACMGG